MESNHYTFITKSPGYFLALLAAANLKLFLRLHNLFFKKINKIFKELFAL
jgi:hypothetical protein